ncbi:outer membrane beta-barrel protein [Echinimonas agarilytica]|uniref:Porin family protein n=1 Tax=Echinimonas agarilytica TaxID=1215918 RepID=A0AA41WBC7_9GAMM|nr:outer membrane beta-barrel protein [Echinimonas agarilytica]MCM2681288.1 porin family protein [Echinimonas agarilytica]
MRIITVVCALLAAGMSPILLAADEADADATQDLLPTTRFLSPEGTLGYWKLAASGQFQVSENVSVEVDYLNYDPLSAFTNATSNAESNALNVRGAYEFTPHWQGFVQVGGGVYLMRDPNTALPLQNSTDSSVSYGGGVRYKFTNGIYFEGVVQVASPAVEDTPADLGPQMSVGYRF